MRIKLREVIIGHEPIELSYAMGEVTEAGKYVTEDGTGSWGRMSTSHTPTGRYVDESMSIEPVTSRGVVHDQVVLRTGHGAEISLRLRDVDLVARKGHWLTLLVGTKRNQRWEYLAILNHHTLEVSELGDDIDRLAAFPAQKLLGLAALLSLVAGSISMIFQAGRSDAPSWPIVAIAFGFACMFGVLWSRAKVATLGRVVREVTGQMKAQVEARRARRTTYRPPTADAIQFRPDDGRAAAREQPSTSH